ncbi:Myristoyl-CoA protein:N-myristoyltransferase [Orpheovirus IHUMI-LCC2]|uniref:glycylpeptide N-tetradecanoyltransferase n=1 Tax=Orpheovirus IHUMI-LCC2 TaxID=2023057 RepID=A0A2I2L363_9VIRU|nr:Myristoyl-CoA protein:N-myristoyltransferase [Orpheovirus IHUMI-LCC2]SNW61963.1 Myristoyl-CoA protein:N-myristoyltransferase [Orpheovirus IHUMI-LCC2]
MIKNISKDHKFWNTQPLSSSSSPSQQSTEQSTNIPSNVKQTPLNLPNSFEWFDCNIHDDNELNNIYNLLYNNYVEDDHSVFRFDYSKSFLKWALTPPGYLQNWHVGLRLKSTHQLLAFISAIPCNIRVNDGTQPMVEINFLCVHKSLRGKRLAPVLIREITRRVNLTNIWQAVFTAGILLPSPISQCKYYHRILNTKKSMDVGFSSLKRGVTLQMSIRSNRLPDKPLIPGLREMQSQDIEQVHELLCEHLSKFKLVVNLSLEDTRHWLLCPDDNVVESYVVEDEVSKKITDFFSFYNLPSSVAGNSKYETLRVAYLFYTVAKTHSLKSLIQDALIIAKNKGYDIFNALDMMDNELFLRDLKFEPGSGNLHYYLFNYKSSKIESKDVGLIML